MSSFKQPNKNAVATKYGWADSKTGELLVSVKGLPNPIENYTINKPFKYQEITSEVIIETKENISEVIEETTPEVIIETKETVTEQTKRNKKHK